MDLEKVGNRQSMDHQTAQPSVVQQKDFTQWSRMLMMERMLCHISDEKSYMSRIRFSGSRGGTTRRITTIGEYSVKHLGRVHIAARPKSFSCQLTANGTGGVGTHVYDLCRIFTHRLCGLPGNAPRILNNIAFTKWHPRAQHNT